MFHRIAGRYDLMNRLMTLGRDRAWRRHTVAQIGSRQPVDEAATHSGPTSTFAVGKPKLILDLATGTGDLAFEALRQYPDSTVVGLDLVPQMLALAQEKAGAKDPAPALLLGDALRLPFADATLDAAVTGFALRNVTDIAAAFAEVARVTRTGGQIACLEIAKPNLFILRGLFTLYFYRIVPLLGGWITGQRAAYTYLPHSLTTFLTPEEIADVLTNTGWRDVCYRRLMFGTVAVHAATRAPRGCGAAEAGEVREPQRPPQRLGNDQERW
jgi:demethylmenaquinone methyltransferase/2-methoxy-6-polyprenyl-1,4-benzoquinol methylase